MRRFILHLGKRHPRDLGGAEVEAFLTHLAVVGKVAASTQIGSGRSLNLTPDWVLISLPRSCSCCQRSLPWLDGWSMSGSPPAPPVVLTVDEVRAVLDRTNGTPGLMLRLIYGTGMRVMECSRLRVKDVDFARWRS